MAVLGCGQRLEILQLLARGARHVTRIAEELFLGIRYVSKDLAKLESTGLVNCIREKTRRVYSLTRRVHVLSDAERIQLVIETRSGQWILVNFDPEGDPDTLVKPPKRFVSSSSTKRAR